MKFSAKNISLTFTAGCVGGLANMLVVWLFGVWGVTKALNVQIAPPFSTPWLYNRLVWGGLWAFLFLLPRRNLSFPARGLLYSLGPTLVQLFIVFPFQAQKGMLGLQLGHLTPAFVLFYNAVWGLAGGFWLQLTAER
ncbi:MAG: hypothetical protein HY790_02620 [Deltaproteobacteria bacterium]|nr:hypothetical protein [Deltaproteobacteria bacterium]MBI4794726.1 hypothetical protein [Deltaproteobacteria bacterium]